MISTEEYEPVGRPLPLWEKHDFTGIVQPVGNPMHMVGAIYRPVVGSAVIVVLGVAPAVQ